ncbi:MAG TPA: hypothetical protein DIV79_15065 [Opitutae bacterium]|nr:hypothetical protein [Verrucomicrobiota bacterium]HCR31325.1 hypothetical protein [Opitutae bacterium]
MNIARAKIVTTILLGFLLSSCSSIRETQIEVDSGNYDYAINRALEGLKRNRSNKKTDEYAWILEEAFAKAVDRDLRAIERWQLENHGKAIEEIFFLYEGLQQRQERIRPIHPVYIKRENRYVELPFRNYNLEIVEAKERFSIHLYDQARERLALPSKADARIAYENLEYLLQLNPGYRDAEALVREAHMKGKDFVLVSLYNESEIALPAKLEEDLLSFESNQFDTLWTSHHREPSNDILYDYEMRISIRGISISPERIREKEVIREKRIKDGYHYELDENGNVLKDENGNDIRSDRYITVRSRVLEFNQIKSVRLDAKVDYLPFQRNELLNSYPLTSEFVFSHSYCTHSGDSRALDDHYRRLVGLTYAPFPSNEQMIYDAGVDLKNQLKSVVSQAQL